MRLLVKGAEIGRPVFGVNKVKNLFKSIMLLSVMFAATGFNSVSASTPDTSSYSALLDMRSMEKLPFDSALVLLKNAINQLQNSEFKILLARLYIVRANLFFQRGDLENALVNFKWARRLLDSVNAPYYYLGSLEGICNVFYYKNKPDSMLQCAAEGLEKAKTINNTEEIASFYEIMGNYYYLTNNNGEALSYYYKALSIYKKLSDKIRIASELINIGTVLQKSNDPEGAKKAYQEALKTGIKEQREDIISVCVNNLGNIYFNNKKYDSALIFMKKSLEMDRKRGDLYGVVASYNNVGSVLLLTGKEHEALSMFLKALQLAKQHRYPVLEALSHENIGDYYSDTTSKGLARMNLDSAIYHFTKVLEIAEKIKSTEYKMDAFKALRNFYALKGDYKKAYDNALKFQEISDTIFSREKTKELEEVKAKYQLKQHEKELLIAKKEAEKIQLVTAITILSLLLFISYLFVLLRARRIKNRRLTERQLFVDKLLENDTGYIVLFSPDRTIQYKSPSFVYDFGELDYEQLINKKIASNDRQDILNAWQMVVEGKADKLPFECQINNREGENRYFTGIISNKLSDPLLSGILVSFWDITGLKESEKALQESEKKFRSIFEAFPDIYFRSDKNSVLTEVSPSVEKITGYKREEVIGKKVMFFYKDPEEWEKARKELYEKKSVHDRTVHMVRKDGSVLVASISGKVLYDEAGKITGTEGVLRDITERVKQEQMLREANDTKDKLFSIIAHDLVGPIGMQKNIIDLILTDINDMSKEEIINFITNMKPALDATFFMIENLLSWARIMRNTIEPRIQKYNIYKLVDQIFDFLHTQAQSKDIRLVFEGDKKLNAMFDKNLLDIVIRNLITNAIKFSSPGSKVTVKAEKEDDKVKISVIDTGVGIPEDVLNDLRKEKHKPLSFLGTKNEKGTGIGLVVVKEFISKQNSKLKIESKIGEGSTFYFELPAG